VTPGAAARYICGAFRVVSGFHDPSQQDLAMVAIYNQWRTISDSIVSQRTLDLGGQKRIVGPVSWRLVMMMRVDTQVVE